MGRRRKNLTPEQITELEKLAAVLTLDQIADFFGISDRTLRTRIHEDDVILAAYKRGKQRAIVNVAGNLIKQANNGNTTAMIFYLKTQAGWRETQTHEHEASDGLKAFVDALK